MLPQSFHNVTVLMEVSASTWETLLAVAGESHRLNGAALSHRGLWDSLTTVSPGGELLDALEVIHELGTEAGRDLLSQASADQQISLGTSDDEPARELAARVWIRSRSDTAFARALTYARVKSLEAEDPRPSREFVGKALLSGPLETGRLIEAVSQWCTENNKSEAVDVYAYEKEGHWYCEVLRMDPVRRVVEIKNRRPSILDFRPAASDHVHYDPETGRLAIATRSPALLRMYREVIGSLLARDKEFFAGENICSLRPLQEKGSDLFEQHRPPGIVRVDVIELRWRRGDRDNIWVRGRDCFKVLRDIGARLVEGELIEARLSIVFRGSGRRAYVALKVPNRIDIRGAGAHESIVEQLLNDTGLRGSFTDEGEQRTLWALYPWRLSEHAWRQHVGRDFDRLVTESVLRSVSLDTATHPDHPAARGALLVEGVNATESVGVSTDGAVPLRSLTPSDYLGFELDAARLARDLQKALQLEGSSSEISAGLWSLGRRSFTTSATVAVYAAVREPTDEAAVLVRETSKGAQAAVIVPTGCSYAGDLPQIQCQLPGGSYRELPKSLIEALGLEGDVPAPLWLDDDLILDLDRGTGWFRKVELTALKASTHPFKFAVEVARAAGRVVSKQALNDLLSPSRTDDEAAKTAKADFVRAVRASFKAAGQECPQDIATFFSSRSGGYVSTGTARVIPS